MPKIVDKEEKKLQIALSAKELILTKGIRSITVAEVAKVAGVGKGTIYEYFKNKNEIVFTLTTILMQEHIDMVQKKLQTLSSTKEKIHLFSQFFYDENLYELREIYKEFISLSLSEAEEQMIEFHHQSMQTYYALFENIIRNGVEKGELFPFSLEIMRGFFSAGNGMFFLYNATGTQQQLQNDLDHFIENMFLIMEKKR